MHLDRRSFLLTGSVVALDSFGLRSAPIPFEFAVRSTDSVRRGASKTEQTPQPRLLYSTIVNQYCGVSYSNEARLNAAIMADAGSAVIANGNGRLLPTYVDPAAVNIVANPRFQSHALGWTIVDATVRFADNGQLLLTSAGGVGAGLRQALPTAPSRAYRASVRITSEPGASGARMIVGANAAATLDAHRTSLLHRAAIAETAVVELVFSTTTNAHTLLLSGGKFDGGTYRFADVDVKEASPLRGAAAGFHSARATHTPGSFSTAQTIVHYSDSDGNNQLRIYTDTAGGVWLFYRWQGVDQFTAPLGKAVLNHPTIIRILFGIDRFAVQMNSQTPKDFIRPNMIASGSLKGALGFAILAFGMTMSQTEICGGAFAAEIFDSGMPPAAILISGGDSLANLNGAGSLDTSIDPYYGQRNYWPQKLCKRLNPKMGLITRSFPGAGADEVRKRWRSVQGTDNLVGPKRTYIVTSGINDLRSATDARGAIQGRLNALAGIRNTVVDLKANDPGQRYLVISVRPDAGNDDFTTTGFIGAERVNLNKALAADAAASEKTSHRHDFWDLAADLIANGLDSVGLGAPNALERSDIANGFIPDRLLVDRLHDSVIGGDAVAISIAKKLGMMGVSGVYPTGTILDLTAREEA